MASTTLARLFRPGPPIPAMGTSPMAANTLIPRGTLVARDSSGNAVSPASASTSGELILGVSNATYDNRTGSEAGGSAGDLDVEYCYGVFGFPYTGTTPKAGDRVFAVDNQTVSIDPTGPRGFAGVVSEVRDGLCWFYVGPIASVGADEIDLSAAEAAIAALEDDATFGEIAIPLGGARIYSTGVIAGAWDDGVADGFDLTAEGLGIRWNPASTVAFAVAVDMPDDIAAGSALTLKLLGYRTGGSDVTMVVTCTAFFRAVGAAFNADTNCGGNSTAFDGATTVVTEETLTIAAGDVPEVSGASLLLTFVPSAALDADDFTLLGARLKYTRAQQATP